MMSEEHPGMAFFRTIFGVVLSNEKGDFVVEACSKKRQLIPFAIEAALAARNWTLVRTSPDLQSGSDRFCHSFQRNHFVKANM
jgi:hypothetical protein